MFDIEHDAAFTLLGHDRLGTEIEPGRVVLMNGMDSNTLGGGSGRLGQTLEVRVREIDRNGKLSLDLADAPPAASPPDDGKRQRGSGDRSRRGDSKGRRDRRDRQDRQREEPESAKPRRKAVSFEEEFARQEGE